MKGYILFGMPGSGKGTFCEKMRMQGYHIFGMGNRLRQREEMKDYVHQGKLIPDALAFQLFCEEIRRIQSPFVIEGFPSTLPQYQLFADFVHLNEITVKCICLECSEEEAIKRVLSRRICKECGKIYNLIYSPPKVEGQCQLCGGSLYCRSEDSRRCIERRIAVYKEKTQPLIEESLFLQRVSQYEQWQLLGRDVPKLLPASQRIGQRK